MADGQDEPELNELPAQEPQRGQGAPGLRQVGPADRRHGIMRHRLLRAAQEILIGGDLLRTPGPVLQRRHAVAVDIGHAGFAPGGGNDRPERVVVPGTGGAGTERREVLHGLQSRKPIAAGSRARCVIAAGLCGGAASWDQTFQQGDASQ